MFNLFKRKNANDADKARVKYIQAVVTQYGEAQLRMAENRRGKSLTDGERNTAEVLVLGAIDYVAATVQAHEEKFVAAVIANIFPDLFGYTGDEAINRINPLLNAYNHKDTLAIMQIGGDSVRDFLKAVETEDNHALTATSETLANILNSGVTFSLST